MCAPATAAAQLRENPGPYSPAPDWTDDGGPLPGGAWHRDEAVARTRDWAAQRALHVQLFHALYNDGFVQVSLERRPDGFALQLADGYRRTPARALSRAARIAAAYLPLDTRRLDIRLGSPGTAGLDYRFENLAVLRRYFLGEATGEALGRSVHVADGDDAPGPATAAGGDPADPADSADSASPADFAAAQAQARELPRESGRSLRELAWVSPAGHGLSLRPYASFYRDTPKGGTAYESGLKIDGSLQIAPGWQAQATLALRAARRMPGEPGDGQTPSAAVRARLGAYVDAAWARLDKATLHRTWQAGPRRYLRASAGWYDAMFAGLGAQALYLSPSRRWALDLAANTVRPREFTGLGLQHGGRTTWMASAHYRPPWAQRLTLTARAGRFLGGDHGTRLEAAYRLAGGLEIGAWYAHGRGSDQGVFLQWPLSRLAGGRGGASAADVRFSRWPGRGAQFLEPPADLARTVRPLLDAPRTPADWQDFADLPPGRQP